MENKSQNSIHKELTLCQKHKSHPIAICVNLACKKPRLACNKCNSDHRAHSEHLISIEYILGKAEYASRPPFAPSKPYQFTPSSQQQQQHLAPSKDFSYDSIRQNYNTQIELQQQKTKFQQSPPFDIDYNSTIFQSTLDRSIFSTTPSIFQQDDSYQYQQPPFIPQIDSQCRRNIFQALVQPMMDNNVKPIAKSTQLPINEQKQESNSLNFPFISRQFLQNNMNIRHDSQSSQFATIKPNYIMPPVMKAEEQDQKSLLPSFIFEEVVTQDENLSKLFGFLQNLDHVKEQLAQKIEGIKAKLFSQLEVFPTDFSYGVVAIALTSNSQVEEKLRTYFTKLNNLKSQYFKTQNFEFNAQYQTRLSQIEEELERLMSPSIVTPTQIPQTQQTSQTSSTQSTVPQSQQPVDENGAKINPENEFEELWEYYRANPSEDITESKKEIDKNARYIIEFDGRAKFSPSRASAGFLIREYDDETAIILEHNLQLGINKTINQAEYLSLIYALHVSNQLGIRHLTVLSDSEVIIKQMQKIHQVRSPQLKDYYQLANLMLSYFYSIHFLQISKQQNIRADSLAAQAL